MSERDESRGAGGDDGHEPFLARWARRKSEARREPAPTAALPDAAATAPGASTTVTMPAAAPALPSSPAATVAPAASEPPPPVQLPDVATLGEDSDYSAFLSPGVDAGLRRIALRKLFSSPKFNVFDGLDTYRDDFRSFPALGDIVTVDMRHQLERLAAKAAELTEPAAPASAASSVATDGGVVAEDEGPGSAADATDAGTVAHPQTPPADAPAASPADSTPAAIDAAPQEYEHDRNSTP